jgi:hypothetical protein
MIYKETQENNMATEVRVKTIVLPGGKIEISTPELIAGQHATVVVTVENNDLSTQHHVIDILLALSGHQLFQSAEEVDAYLREERNSNP